MDDSFLIQVLGDNKRPDGIYDLALFFYDKCSRNQDAYKLNDDNWWFVNVVDVFKMIKDPVEEKITDRRKLYYFTF